MDNILPYVPEGIVKLMNDGINSEKTHLINAEPKPFVWETLQLPLLNYKGIPSDVLPLASLLAKMMGWKKTIDTVKCYYQPGAFEEMLQRLHAENKLVNHELSNEVVPSIFQSGEYIFDSSMPVATAYTPQHEYYSAPLSMIIQEKKYHEQRVFTEGSIVSCEAPQPIQYTDKTGKFLIFHWYEQSVTTPTSQNFVVRAGDSLLPCTIGSHYIKGLDKINTHLSRFKIFDDGNFVKDSIYTRNELDVLIDALRNVSSKIVLGGVNIAGRLVVDTILTPGRDIYLFALQSGNEKR